MVYVELTPLPPDTPSGPNRHDAQTNIPWQASATRRERGSPGSGIGVTVRA